MRGEEELIRDSLMMDRDRLDHALHRSGLRRRGLLLFAPSQKKKRRRDRYS